MNLLINESSEQSCLRGKSIVPDCNSLVPDSNESRYESSEQSCLQGEKV